MSPLFASLRNTAHALAAAAVLIACASEPPAPVSRENVTQLTATVTAVDLDSRLVSLQGPGGRMATVYAGPEVRNLAQVEVGDVVTVSYYEAIGAEVTTPERASQPEQATARLRAAAGSRPGGAIGQASTTTVEIESVDTSFNTVTFRRPDGMVRTIAIQDPDSQRFIRELKRGDLVQVTYMEAVAVSVQPAG